MTILPIVLGSAAVLLVAYLTYGRWVMRWLGVDATRTTPALELNDGNDYCPAPAPVVLGGHFTAIAAAGPVVGPIVAGLMFGWLPALIWIVVGSILIGAVHDSGSLLASIRHKAASITQVVREHMSRGAYVTFLAFVWLSLIYVIVAFTDVTASTFAKFEQFDMTLDGQPVALAVNGGAVVVGATAYLILSVGLGLMLRFTRVPWWIGLLLAVSLMSLAVVFASSLAQTLASWGLTFLDTSTGDQAALSRGWDLSLIVYCFFASVAPLWLLLQPRGLIGATFLYATLGFGIVGTLIGGWGAGSLTISYPMIIPKNLHLVFPLLFITIACGACSGFHSIVASGTTSKQVRSEQDVKPIGYGAMMLEAMVAVLALSCVMVLASDAKAGTPDAVFARGVGNFMSQLGIPLSFAVLFGLLAFSSFVFDTLDVCTRLGRYVFQELTGLRGLVGGAVATIITLSFPAMYLWTSPPGSFRTFWTIFGTSNQLLAALTLVGVSVWLWRTGRPVWFALAPAVFMLITTATALVYNFNTFLGQYQATQGMPHMVNMAIAFVLLVLAGFVAIEACRAMRRGRLAVEKA
jgi:carbon starvation protein